MYLIYFGLLKSPKLTIDHLKVEIFLKKLSFRGCQVMQQIY